MSRPQAPSLSIGRVAVRCPGADHAAGLAFVTAFKAGLAETPAAFETSRRLGRIVLRVPQGESNSADAGRRAARQLIGSLCGSNRDA
jgi:hypothetical protein